MEEQGLQDNLVQTIDLKRIDSKHVVETETVQITHDTDKLAAEKNLLLDQLNLPQPTDDDLIAVGKLSHPYYTNDKNAIQERIAEIDTILNS